MSKKNHLFLAPEDWEIFKGLIAEVPCQVYAFGSRVKEVNQKFSDIDLCLLGEISDEEVVCLKMAFEDSDLPMKVDIKKREELSDAFFESIQPDLFLIKP